MPFDETRRATLRVVCDTIVPSIEHEPDPHGLWAMSASQLMVPETVEQLIDELPPEQHEGMMQLLDGLGQQGIAGMSQRSREQILKNVSLLGAQAAAGVGGLISMTLFIAYGAPDPRSGINPMWEAMGFAGPPRDVPAAEPVHVQPLVPSGTEFELEADVVVVGSGAGGGVIAGKLAQGGAKVVVLEMGQFVTEPEMTMLELPAYQSMYWRGGPQPTADLNVTVYAGSTYGGGTTINWTNCLRTRPWVREQWEQEFGLEGLAGSEFDRHLDNVWNRIGVNDQCSDWNGPHQRMKEGADKLGYSFARITRNTDPDRYDPVSAGYIGFGDKTGSKNSTMRTYLQDAVEAGADVMCGVFVEKVLVDGGRAAGVEGTWTDVPTGRTAHVVVRAPQVVVAAGSLESPALLLRSGIGGPAVGQNLRIHPCTALFGVYPDDQETWWGAPQTGLVDEFANIEDGWGFLVESTQYAPALGASATPFTTAREHKDAMENFAYGATFIGLIRDHGGGQVTIDENGQAVPWYGLHDPIDVRTTMKAIEVQARLHHAAGAKEIRALAGGMPRWRWGDDLDAYIAKVQQVPLRFGGFRLFCAHQMGTCRMGVDPATSVAGPFGELHDVPGVWIGDGSAFPTASGTNPMLTIMALADRTAEAIAQSAGRPRETAAQAS